MATDGGNAVFGKRSPRETTPDTHGQRADDSTLLLTGDKERDIYPNSFRKSAAKTLRHFTRSEGSLSMDSEPDDPYPPPAYTPPTPSPRVRRSGGSNKTLCRRLVKVVKSLGGQAALLLAYTFLGAWMMMSIEGPREDSLRQQVSTARERARWMLKNITEDLQAGLLNHTEWDRHTHDTLLGFESQVHESGVSSTSKKKWTFFGSVLFCFTTYTTIGYGNIAPASKAGRVATMLYATLGIPLALIVLADLGRRFAVTFKFLWGFLRRYYYTGYCRKVRHKVCDKTDSFCPGADCERGRNDSLVIQRPGSYRKVEKDSHQAGIIYREEREGGGGDVTEGKRPKVSKEGEVEAREDPARKRAGQSSVGEVSTKKTSPDVECAGKEKSHTASSKESGDTKGSSERGQCGDKGKGSTGDHTDHKDHKDHSDPKDHTDDTDHPGIHDEYKLPVPVAVGFIFAYIFIGAGMYTLWEDWTYLESFYFVFITTSTIGFGDVLPEHPNFFLLSCVYTFLGLALVSMTVNVIVDFMARTMHLAKDSVDSAAEKAVAKAKAATGVLVKVGSRAKSNIRKTISSRKKKKSRKSKLSSRKKKSPEAQHASNGIEVKDDSDVVPQGRVSDAVIAAGGLSQPDGGAVKDVKCSLHDTDRNDNDKHGDDRNDSDKHDNDRNDSNRNDSDRNDSDRNDSDEHDNDKHDNDRNDSDRNDSDRNDSDEHDNDKHDNDRNNSV
ncbi:hypothetical protein ACOMHN_028525 [Nucella lapillus]